MVDGDVGSRLEGRYLVNGEEWGAVGKGSSYR